jgi:hypothetical protein
LVLNLRRSSPGISGGSDIVASGDPERLACGCFGRR